MFITLEGPDGSGKTSHMQPLAEWLEGQGYRVHTGREPGGTLISEQIRNIIHDLKNTEMHPHTETLLYQAARAQIVEQVIRPKLADGWIVLCDRYADSTLAYQGYGHQQNLDEVRALVRYATGGLLPDLTLLLDVDVETGLSRRQTSGGEWNRLDAYQLDFHRRVREGYLELAKLEPNRWVRVDASRSLELVQADLRNAILKRLDP
jgi:dTMP kinase